MDFELFDFFLDLDILMDESLLAMNLHVQNANLRGSKLLLLPSLVIALSLHARVGILRWLPSTLQR